MTKTTAERVDEMNTDSACADPFTEADLTLLHLLDLTKPAVLNRLARVVGILLETVNPERTTWYATPRDAQQFKGSLAEVGAFVRGYAAAYRGQRSAQRDLARAFEKFFQEHIDRTSFER